MNNICGCFCHVVVCGSNLLSNQTAGEMEFGKSLCCALSARRYSIRFERCITVKASVNAVARVCAVTLSQAIIALQTLSVLLLNITNPVIDTNNMSASRTCVYVYKCDI